MSQISWGEWIESEEVWDTSAIVGTLIIEIKKDKKYFIEINKDRKHIIKIGATN